MEIVGNMSYEEKCRFYRNLGDMLARERNIEKARRNTEMRRLAEEIKQKVFTEMGISVYSSRSREHQFVIARVIIANILLRKGGTGYGIGVILGKGHSAINNYKRTLEDWLEYPKYYEEEISIWNKISKQYETE